MWGALANAGQTCAGVERVYAVASVHAALCARIVHRVRDLHPGPDPDSPYGPLSSRPNSPPWNAI